MAEEKKEVKTYHPFPTEDPVSGNVKAVRDRHPAHYLLKIDSFSFLLEMLKKTGAQSYDTETFEASGYKWKLSLYPNGDAERDGKGYISLYLCIQETDALPHGWEINASGKLSRFHELKKEWGFTRLLSRSAFEDTTQGYLLKDKCAFGVEVLANKYAKGECVGLPKKLSNTTYTWSVTDYSTLRGEISSDVFIIGDCRWKLSLYPKGNGEQKGKTISIFLEFQDLETTARVYAEYMVCLKSEKNGKDCKRTGNDVFSASSTCWGWPSFMSLQNIENVSKGFLVEDTLTIQVEITRIAVVESFSQDFDDPSVLSLIL